MQSTRGCKQAGRDHHAEYVIGYIKAGSMNANLSRRVARCINYLAIHDMIPGKSRAKFANRIDRANTFFDLPNDDKNCILAAERALRKYRFKRNQENIVL
jgi:hypothetical protein